MKLFNQTYQSIALIDAPKIHTDVLWDLSILFGGIALVYFTAIFFFRNKISGSSKKTSNLKTTLSPMISEFIFYDETGSKEEKTIYINLKVKIRDMLKDDFKRKTISEILLELRKDVSGVAQQRLFELFQDLELHKDSYQKLESWRWEYISSGIQELTRMEVHDAYGFLTKFVNDKRNTIRKQAEIAIVTLDPEGINYFLDTTRNKISEWQQLKLIEVLSNKTDFVPPSFKSWLVSKNKYVVLFALRLIKYYDQNDANTSIIELVKHRDDQIKQEAIDCIKAFHLTSSLPILKKVFWGCSIDIKIAILDAIANLGSTTEIPFLESIAKKERNYSVTSKALGAINTIAPDTVLPTEGIADISNTSIPEDIPELELSVEDAIETETLKNKDYPISEESIALENVETEAMEINTIGVAVETSIDVPIQKEADSIDVNSMEVEFTTDFLPLVTEINTVSEEIDITEESRINAIEVVYEKAFEKYAPETNNTPLIDPLNLEVITDVDFLPLVVSNDAEPEKTIDLNALNVVFETVSSEKETEINLEELEVRYEIIEVITIDKEIALEEITVVFDEVIPEKIEISFEMEDHLSEHFDFEIIFNNGQPPLRIPKVETGELFDTEVNVAEVVAGQKELLNIEVVAETEQGDNQKNDQELPSWLLNEIANEDANYKNRMHLKMEGPDWEAKESQMMNQLQDYIKNMPSSDHLNEDVNETIQLLDDIELFGDEREIPLLQELMQKEDKVQTKERIDDLMKRFMGTDTYGKGLEDTSSYSVFEELFRNCDTESKLILLDEIIMIGDEKEALFLEQLCNDPIQEIREKAANSLKKLNERFDRVATGDERKDAQAFERFINLMEINPSKTNEDASFLQIDFDIDSDEEDEKLQVKEKEGNSFVNFFSDVITKLVKYTNGL